MGLGSECSLHESVEDNDSITNVSAFKMLEDHDGSKNNGYCAVEDGRFSVIEGKGSDILGSVKLWPLETNHEVSPIPSLTKKGVGLKKWKRIKRDANKNGDGSVDAGKMVKQDFFSPDANTSEQLQFCVGTKQKSEAYVSSTDAVVRSLDGFALLGDSGLVIEPSFAAGTDSENSEDHARKPCTAASAQKSRYMTSGSVGVPQARSNFRSSSGKNSMRSVQRGPKVKNRVETGNKAGGKLVQIEKENSHSSIESDSRNSNVLFIRGTYRTSKGKQSVRPGASERETGNKFYGRGSLFNNDYETDYEGRYNGKSIDDLVVDSSRGCENHSSLTVDDSLVDSILALQSAQEALEKEVLKFGEIIHDVSNDDSVRNLLPEFEDVSQKLQQAKLEWSQHDEGELEYHFKQKFEAEVEYLVLSRILGDHKAVAYEELQMLEKLQDTEKKAKMIKNEASIEENCCEDIASANDMLTLQYGIFKYTLCFFMQLVLLVVTIVVFMFQLLPYYVYDVPT